MVFVFQICTLFEKFKILKFSNFQTIVIGLRNSTAGRVVLILYCILCTASMLLPLKLIIVPSSIFLIAPIFTIDIFLKHILYC